MAVNDVCVSVVRIVVNERKKKMECEGERRRRCKLVLGLL